MFNCIYLPFDYPNATIGSKTTPTGIRYRHTYYITGNYINAGTTTAFLYRGDLTGRPNDHNKFYNFNYPGSTTTSLYGPDIISHNKVHLVGNYTIDIGNPKACLYMGSIHGNGIWKTLIPDSSYSIAHSTMGNLVVGNYLTTTPINRAFLYDITTDHYFKIKKPHAIYVTAYGIWHNGGSSYTICGGYSNLPSTLDSGYLVDWNNDSHQFSNWRNYTFPRSTISHFDGISGNGCGKYTLTGFAVVDGATIGFFAQVTRRDGKFSKAEWEKVSYPDSVLTTGNSVSKDIVIGVYNTGTNTVHGFLSLDY